MHRLNKEIISRLEDPTDAQELRNAITRSIYVSDTMMRPSSTHYYALRVAKQTGIYHGFDW